MLGRETLPRQELVVALLTACGAGPDEVSRWIEARRRLAAQGARTPKSDDAPRRQDDGDQELEQAASDEQVAARDTGAPTSDSGASGRTGGRQWLLVAAVAVAVAVTTGLALVVRAVGDNGATRAPESGARAGGTSLPPAGYYRIRAVHSDRCLSERHDGQNGNVYQTDCDRIFVDRALDPVGGGYVVRTFHPIEGPGCMGVQGHSEEVGGIVADDFCGSGAEEFTIEAVTTPLPGFRIRPTHSGHCIGVLGGATQDWAPLRQEACDPEAKGQVFHFDSVPTPTSSGTKSNASMRVRS
ncbi:hypothetical protein SAMN05421684_4910 [Asanoa ishikariensis]|uniref:Ricin-type beta-trefoil lectin domain-containing protein n=2 Tax=Asanoa ishikariensis TaxID=137265 RepID=A0A1H3SXY3_9ACTN|nr:hypothetical protein SAMN05421684_4910 [Asanoa ishikariensis]